MTPTVVLTIGASDPSGGSGIQADLRTLSALRMFGASVVTAVLSRNSRTTCDVFGLPASVLSAQLAGVLDDLPVAAVKTGVFPTVEAAIVVASRARDGVLPNLVVDPVLSTGSGSRKGLATAMERLLAHAMVATPNREEASALVGWQVATPDEMAEAAKQIAAGGPRYVVVTGGDFVIGPDAVDVMWADGSPRILHCPRTVSQNTAGSGTTFATAIAARLAMGETAPEAIAYAKGFVGRAIGDAADWRLGSGRGNHNGPIDQFGWSSQSLVG